MSTRTSAVRMSSKGCPSATALARLAPRQTACRLRLVIEHHLPQLLLLGERGHADTIRTDCCQVRKEQFHNHFWLLLFVEVGEKRIHAKVLKNFNHSCGTNGRQAGRQKRKLYPLQWDSKPFRHLHDVPCLLFPTAGVAWVLTRFHQLETRRLESSRCKPVKREFTSKTEDLLDTAAENMPVSST